MTGFKLANRYQAVNLALHDWDEMNGTLGISYCPYSNQPIDADTGSTSTSTNPTYCYTFQRLLSNLSSNLIFALDLNEPATPSFVHLGGINASYQSSIQWSMQPTSTLTMHEFLMKDLRLDCANGGINGNDDDDDDGNANYVNTYGNSKRLLSRYGNVWPAGVHSFIHSFVHSPIYLSMCLSTYLLTYL